MTPFLLSYYLISTYSHIHIKGEIIMRLAADETIKTLEYLKETALKELRVFDETETSDIIYTTAIVYRQACKLMKALMEEHLPKEVASGEYATFIYHQTTWI